MRKRSLALAVVVAIVGSYTIQGADINCNQEILKCRDDLSFKVVDADADVDDTFQWSYRYWNAGKPEQWQDLECKTSTLKFKFPRPGRVEIQCEVHYKDGSETVATHLFALTEFTSIPDLEALKPKVADPAKGPVEQVKGLSLLRIVEFEYANFPQADPTSVDIRKRLNATRSRMTVVKKIAQLNRFDENIIGLFTDFLKLLDEYNDFLKEAGTAQLFAPDKVNVGIVEVAEVVGSGISVGTSAIKFGGPGVAAAVGAIVMIRDVRALVQKQNQAEAKNAEIIKAIEKNAEILNGHYKTFLDGARTVANRYRSDCYSDVPGFQPQHLEFENFLTSWNRLKEVDFNRSRKPEESKSLLEYCRLRAAMWNDDAEKLSAGQEFEVYKRSFKILSGLFANAASDLEFRETRVIPTQTSKLGLRMFDEALAGAQDISAYLKFQRGLAHHYAGEFTDAVAMMSTASQDIELIKTPFFNYRFACSLSRDGKIKEALNNLQRYFEVGGEKSAWDEMDPDLAEVRAKEQEAFEKIAKVQFDHKIEWNWIWFDDRITLYNNSKFALSNIKFKLEINDAGAVFTTVIKVPQLQPGESYKKKLVIGARGANARTTYELECDQDFSVKKIQPVGPKGGQ